MTDLRRKHLNPLHEVDVNPQLLEKFASYLFNGSFGLDVLRHAVLPELQTFPAHYF